MKLPELGVKRPVTTMMIFVGIFVLGAYSLYKLPIDLLPKIDPPMITVVTMYTGASAKDIEEKISKPLENTLSIVSNIKHVDSTSSDGVSVVRCTFDWGVNMAEVANDVRENIDFVKGALPDGSTKPMVIKISTAMMPIYMFTLTSKTNYKALYRFAKDKVADPLKRIPGVGGVTVFGGVQRQINIRLDRDKMAAYNISPQMVAGAVATQNMNMPAGTLKLGTMEYTIRVPAEFGSTDDIGATVIGAFNGASIRIQDVAEVLDGVDDIAGETRMNGNLSIFGMVQKQSGSNTVDVAKGIVKWIGENKKYFPNDIELTVVNDNSEFIVKSIDNLTNSLRDGAILVFLVVLFFLRGIKSTFIILVSMPTSLIVAFLLFYVFGYTINSMSLSSLAIAIGMVVDDAVVVLENITRHLDKGERPDEASMFGAGEVGLAVTASTMTNVVIFVPMLFLSGIVGILFKQLAFSMVATMLTSLFVSLTIIPMLTSQLLKAKADRKKHGKFFAWSENLFIGMERFYEATIGWALRHRKTTLGISFGVFFASLVIFVLFVGKDFMPSQDTGDLRIRIELPSGTRLSETLKAAGKVEKIIRDNVPEAKWVYIRAGKDRSGFGSIMGDKTSPNTAQIGTKLGDKGKRKRSVQEIGNAIRDKIAAIPELRTSSIDLGDPMAAMFGGGNGKSISMEIYGRDFEELKKASTMMKEKMAKIKGLKDVDTTYPPDIPDISIVIDKTKASMTGVNVATISDVLTKTFMGQTIGKFRERGDEFDINIQLSENYRGAIEDIEAVNIPTMTGRSVRLGEVARVEGTTTSEYIERKDQERIVKVQAATDGKIATSTVEKEVDKIIEEIKGEVSGNIVIKPAGNIKERKEAFGDLSILLIISILFVYMVMASQFESLILPFIIMFSIPFAFTGVVFGLLLTKTSLTINAFIGLIMLVGIVVKNAIVFVDYANILRKRRVPLYRALITAGGHRLRPILMTTLSTLLGMVPLAMSTGSGSETWRPMGIAVIGGLTFSTGITLIILPVIYSIVEEKFRNKRHREKMIIEENVHAGSPS